MTTHHPAVPRRVLAAVAAAVLAGTTLLLGVAPTTARAADDSTFRMSITSAISTFNPFTAYFAGETIAIGEAYRALYGEELKARLDEELSGDDKAITDAHWAGNTERADAIATERHQAQGQDGA